MIALLLAPLSYGDIKAGLCDIEMTADKVGLAVLGLGTILAFDTVRHIGRAEAYADSGSPLDAQEQIKIAQLQLSLIGVLVAMSMGAYAYSLGIE